MEFISGVIERPLLLGVVCFIPIVAFLGAVKSSGGHVPEILCIPAICLALLIAAVITFGHDIYFSIASVSSKMWMTAGFILLGIVVTILLFIFLPEIAEQMKRGGYPPPGPGQGQQRGRFLRFPRNRWRR